MKALGKPRQLRTMIGFLFVLSFLLAYRLFHAALHENECRC